MKTVLTIIFVLMCNVVTPHYTTTNNLNTTSLDNKEVITTYIPWTCEKEGYWGSFWWKVTREKKSDGQHYFTVYTYSNSTLNEKGSDGKYRKAITKISDCIVRVDDWDEEGPVDFKRGTVLTDYNDEWLFEFYTDSGDANPEVEIIYSEVKPYDYSKY